DPHRSRLPPRRRSAIPASVRIPANSRARRLHRPQSERYGFSLIELFVTLILMLIVLVMLYGFSSQSNQERKIKACQNNLQKIYVALEIFAKEHQDAFPLKPDAKTSEEPLSALVPQYTVASDAFVCPGSKDSAIPPAESLLRRRIS